MSGDEDDIGWFTIFILIFVSLTIAALTAAYTYHPTDGNIFVSSILFVATALVHPIIGALVVAICEKFKQWAYLNKAKKWDRDDKVFLGTFWPLTLFFCVIIFIFVGISNRVY